MPKLLIFSVILLNSLFSQGCSYNIHEIYFNENILTFYLDSFDNNTAQSQVDFFTYQVVPLEGNQQQATLSIEYTFNIYAPEIGMTHYETFYNGKTEMSIGSEVRYFKNSDFSIVSGPTVTNNSEVEKLISYISQSGRLPNGKYLFQFILSNNSSICTLSKSVDINRPLTLDLLSPGGLLSELTHSYTYSTVPIFTWYSDFCKQCTHGIRICEFNQDEHGSLQAALDDWSLLPYDQSNEYHEIPWTTLSFQYPVEGHMDLEVGKHYVWQIRRSYETTLEPHHDYSPIYIFEVRSPTKKQLDFTDPYLSVIQSLIGKEQYNLWFSTGGELERFVTTGESIWINGEELHIDALYSLVAELNQGKITLENIQIK